MQAWEEAEQANCVVSVKIEFFRENKLKARKIKAFSYACGYEPFSSKCFGKFIILCKILTISICSFPYLKNGKILIEDRNKFFRDKYLELKEKQKK